mmetsp:Transcript_28723/g.66908  ORF Transcript_28723/g.66908 Transcript_28723/m.66908 type:complete len:279 (+) Transcript_28723:61-897(+)
MATSPSEPVAVLSPRLAKVLTLDGRAVDGIGILNRMEKEIASRAHAIWESSGEQHAEQNWLAAERSLIRRKAREAPQDKLANDLVNAQKVQILALQQALQAKEKAQDKLSNDLVNAQKGQIVALQQALEAREEEVADLRQQLSSALARTEPSWPGEMRIADLAPWWDEAEVLENLVMEAGNVQEEDDTRRSFTETATTNVIPTRRIKLRASLGHRPPVREERRPRLSEIEQVRSRLRRPTSRGSLTEATAEGDPAFQRFAVRLQAWRSLADANRAAPM